MNLSIFVCSHDDWWLGAQIASRWGWGDRGNNHVTAGLALPALSQSAGRFGEIPRRGDTSMCGEGDAPRRGMDLWAPSPHPALCLSSGWLLLTWTSKYKESVILSSVSCSSKRPNLKWVWEPPNLWSAGQETQWERMGKCELSLERWRGSGVCVFRRSLCVLGARGERTGCGRHCGFCALSQEWSDGWR